MNNVEKFKNNLLQEIRNNRKKIISGESCLTDMDIIQNFMKENKEFNRLLDHESLEKNKKNKKSIKIILFDKDDTLIYLKNNITFISENIKKLKNLNYEPNILDKVLLDIGLKKKKIKGNDEYIFESCDIFRPLSLFYHKKLLSNLIAKYSDQNPIQIFENLNFNFNVNYQQKLIDKETIHDILKVLKKKDFKIGILSNSKKPEIESFIENYFDKNTFDYIIGANSIDNKPDIKVIEEFCKENNILPEQIAIVGDSIVDIFLARLSGCLAIGKHTRDIFTKEDYEYNFRHADFVIDSFDKIKDIIK